jgi:hypothetical protein
MGVSKEGKVADRGTGIGQPLTRGKVPLHHVERPLATHTTSFQALRLCISRMEVGTNVAGDRDEGFMTVLFPEQPLQHAVRARPGGGSQEVPSARWARIAFASAMTVPSSVSTTGTLPIGKRARKAGVRVSPPFVSTSTQRKSCPVRRRIWAAFQQLPDGAMPKSVVMPAFCAGFQLSVIARQSGLNVTVRVGASAMTTSRRISLQHLRIGLAAKTRAFRQDEAAALWLDRCSEGAGGEVVVHMLDQALAW